MDDFDISFAKDEIERGESAIAESNSLYNKCVPSQEGAEENLIELLKKKHELKCQFLAACEERLILQELLKPPDKWTRVKDAEWEACEREEMSKEFEMKAVVKERMDQMMQAVDVATHVFDSWRRSLDVLSQKVEDLKAKKSELEGVEFSLNSLSLHRVEVKNQLEKVNILLEASQAEQSILRERLARTESSLEYLSEVKVTQERRYSQRRSRLQSLKQKREDVQKLSGVQCHIVDESRVQIILQPRDLVDFADISESNGDDLVNDCKFTVDLQFVVNDEGCMEIYDVQTENNSDEVQKLIARVKEDKDLPHFISSLRNTWLSYLPLNAELSRLRKHHAIDFRQDLGVLQLIINKRSIVCSLNVPKSYPQADVTLASITGPPEVTADDISAPETKSLTAWVKHLEDLLGQKQ